jgi:ribosome maturation factor RimP
MSAPLDFTAFIGRTVQVVGGGAVIGANGTTTIEAIEGDTLWLQSGKGIRRPIDIRKIDSATLFPETANVGSRKTAPR